ncbi:hypothetical protein ES288_A07G238200v1 [Gossypium darwinii]|uniref:Response regulatory domain-containing protein n=1 Tax=Gossypium darwinii TaxID=34276 RepID=A0A5D2FYW4_GOSDA|nr:hypothetical protein ES288_A07G238200v1 [Gossypium darwinii]
MAPTLASGDQASNKDSWDSGRLARKRQLLIEIALRNRLIALVVDGVATCVDNGKGAVDLIAFGAKFHLMMTDMILLVLNGLKMPGVTTCSEESGRQAFLSTSVDVFVDKPLDLAHLVPILRELDG